MTKSLRILLLPLLASLSGIIPLLTIPPAFANQEQIEAAPTLLVLYKDQSGNFTTHTNDDGDLLLDIRHGQPITRMNANTTEENLIQLTDRQIPVAAPLALQPLPRKQKRSTHEQMARVLVPFGVAALAFDGITKTTINRTSLNLQANFGHYMVLATVNNLAQYVDEATVELLGEHHLGGVIPPEWAAKGAVAVLMLGMGGVQSLAAQATHQSVGRSITFFAQSHTINNSNLMLGEVSGQVLDRIVGLSPKTRKIVTAALGGAATGGLYYQLTEMFGNRNHTINLHSKISHATLIGMNAATTPFLKDFVSLATDNPLWKHLGAYSILETVSLASAGGLYTLVSHYPTAERTGSIYLAQLLAGSFSKLAGLNAVEIVGNKTINMLYADKDQKLTISSRPALKAIAYLSITLAATQIYRRYGAMGDNPLLQAALFGFRDGVYTAAIANGVTGLLGDFMQTLEAPQPITINLNSGNTEVSAN